MAYYNYSSYYENNNGQNTGEYPLSPYYNNYYDYPPPPQVSMASSITHEFFAYDNPPPFLAAYENGNASSCPRIEYSVSSLNEPKFIEYHPPPYYPINTRFRVSHSVSEFNEPDFEEYDPTPYGGGYDITQTYGKSLPPSDDICYPRSGPHSTSLPSSGSSTGLIPVPKKREEEVAEKAPEEPPIQSQPVAEKAPEEPPIQSQPASGKGEEDKGGSESEELGYKQVPHVPSGYGLEAMDVCESLFGYWPCLSRYNDNKGRGHDCGQGADCGNYYYGNSWQRTADYLFGSLNPYDNNNNNDNIKRDFNETSCGNGTYGGYERHCQDQPLHLQFDYVEDSWHG